MWCGLGVFVECTRNANSTEKPESSFFHAKKKINPLRMRSKGEMQIVTSELTVTHNNTTQHCASRMGKRKDLVANSGLSAPPRGGTRGPPMKPAAGSQESTCYSSTDWHLSVWEGQFH